MKKKILFISVVACMLFFLTIHVSAATYLWPAPGVSYISQYYGSGHAGIDIAANGDREIVAAREGTVKAAASTSCSHLNQSHSTTSPTCNYGMGNYVQIQHSDGTYATYMHLRYGSVTVSKGQSVSRGQKIGMMGSSGNSTGQHLHFQLGYSSTNTINVNPDSLGYDYNNSYDPQGILDEVTGGAGTVKVRGWAFDKDDTSKALSIHVYIGGESVTPGAEGHGNLVANKSRTDVNNVYGCGNNHGFEDTITTSKRGSQVVSVYAINIGGGSNVLIGKKTVNITNPPTPGKPTLKLNGTTPFTTGNAVNFSWGATSNTVCYDLKIYDWSSPAKLIKQIQGIQGTSYSITLPKGNYSAVLFSKNTIGSTEGNWISFQIFDRVATPVITPSNVVGGKNITLSCATSGAAIYYTTNGSNPTTSSTKYTAPFMVSANTTIKAIAVASGYTNSAVASSTVNVGKIATPTITVSNTADGKNVTLSCATSGAAIYYTLDGSNPTRSTAKYTAPFKVTKNATVKARAVANGYAYSDVASTDIKVMQSVTVNPNGGMVNSSSGTITETKDYGTTLDLIPTPPEDLDFAGFTADGEGTVMPYGKTLFKDTLFENGVNSMQPYNNGESGKDGIKIERVPASGDCPTNSDYMIKIQSVGKTFPEYGGYAQITKSKANGIFYHVIVAKIPKGYMIQNNRNANGDYSFYSWLTSKYGTGEWETYIYETTCGAKGNFDTLGYVSIARVSKAHWQDQETIDSSQEENPFTWYLAYSNMFDATDITANRTKDPSFTTSDNGASVYNNEDNGAVIIERETMKDDSSKYVLKITANGTSRPSYGGFAQHANSKPNGVFYHFLTAKIPKGYSLNIAYNPCGDNSKHTWITDNKGTNDWAHYIYKTECGSEGRFSTFGHVFLTKNENAVPDGERWDKGWSGSATTDEPLTWYVRYSDMIDMTPRYVLNGTGAVTARWSKQRCARPKSGISDESVIFASTPVTLTTDTEGADIYYTLDGTSPTSESELYTEPLYLPEGDVTLKAAAFKDGYTESYRCNYDYHVYANEPKIYNAVSSTRNYYNIMSEFENPVPSTYIIAFYDADGKLLDMLSQEVKDNTELIEKKIDKIEGAAYAKIFLWDKIKNMRPFAESEMYNLN